RLRVTTARSVVERVELPERLGLGSEAVDEALHRDREVGRHGGADGGLDHVGFGGKGVGGEEFRGAHLLSVPGEARREEAGGGVLLPLHERRVDLGERPADAVLGPLPVGDGDQAGDRAEREDPQDPPFSAVHHIIASKWNWTVQRKVTKRKAATASANRLILSATSFRSIAHSFRMRPTTVRRKPAA